MTFAPGYVPEIIHMIAEILSISIGVFYYSQIYKGEADKEALNTPTEDADEGSLDKSLKKTLLLLGAAAGAFIGSRLLGALDFPELFFNPPSVLYYFSVKTVAGGIAGGIIGVEIIKKMMGIKKSTGDIMVGPLALGIIIGRIGCFMLGVRDHTVGNPSNLPWAFDQGDGIARHPTSLYEIGVVLILWIVTDLLKKKYSEKYPVGSGLYFRVFVAGYFLYRLFVEFIKPISPLAFGLTGIQIASALFSAFYLISIVKIIRQHSK